MNSGLPVLLACLGLAAASAFAMSAPPKSNGARAAAAQGSDRWREQVILFRHEIQDGRRIDRDDPYLPRLDAEAAEDRRLNFERCQVAMEQRLATGQVRKLRYDDPRTLFALEVDGKRWREDPDETVLDDVACLFTAGDSRRRILFPVTDENGQLIGRWRWSKFVIE